MNGLCVVHREFLNIFDVLPNGKFTTSFVPRLIAIPVMVCRRIFSCLLTENEILCGMNESYFCYLVVLDIN